MALLTLAAYVFYGWHKPWFVLLMMYSTVCDYYAARIIAAPGSSQRLRKGTLAVAVINNLLLLGYFKYGVFAQENAQALLHLLGQQGFRIMQITLPIASRSTRSRPSATRWTCIAVPHLRRAD